MVGLGSGFGASYFLIGTKVSSSLSRRDVFVFFWTCGALEITGGAYYFFLFGFENISSSPSSSSPKRLAFLPVFLMGFCSKAGFSSSSSENNPFFGFLDGSGCLTFFTVITYSSYSSKSIFFLATCGC